MQWLIDTGTEFLLLKNAFVAQANLFGNLPRIFKTEWKQDRRCKKGKNARGNM